MSDSPLYPFLFKPILKQKVWGGGKLHQLLGKEDIPHSGESWEISAVPGSLSTLVNGPLAGKNLQQLVAEFGPRLTGKRVYEKYGQEFPLLFKFIDAREDLSVQLHPSDALARERHGSFGKNEMWYILQADPGARLIIGFNRQMDRASYAAALEEGKLVQVLREVPVTPGDAFYLQTGTVHAIGGGILLAEIQQTSDITYRLYDWDRPGSDGAMRELHTDLALEAIDFDPPESALSYQDTTNEQVRLARTPYFLTNKLSLDHSKTLQLGERDSFTVLMCTSGTALLVVNHQETAVKEGDSVLLPACLDRLEIRTDNCTLLDVSIP